MGTRQRKRRWLIRIGSMNAHKSTAMTEIRDDIKKILRRLPADPIGAGSPLSLTEYGEGLSEKLNAEMWAKQEADSLRDADIGTEPFEIAEFSFEHVRTKYPTTRDMSVSLRTAIYEHGIDKDHVYSVLAIVLRDELINRAQQAR